MTTLIESTLMSLDGVVEDPMRWANFDDEARAVAQDNLRRYDGFLLGRTTYELFRGAWSGVTGDPYLDAVNTARKYVVSDSLPDDPGWNAEVLRRGAAAIAERKRRSGRPLVKYGSGRLTRMLVEYHLIDEFQFWIFPVRVGRGRRLFEDLDGPAPPLTLTGTRTLASGVVILSYAVGGEPTSGTFLRAGALAARPRDRPDAGGTGGPRPGGDRLVDRRS
jgi:dihydrofolate reductase